MNQISIPKPCHENWNEMLPETQGRHCLACSKTVVDFSDWETPQILDYLQTRNNEKVCGRFNAGQLSNEPEQDLILPFIIRSNVSILKKIAAIVLLCFGVMTTTKSQAQKITGKVAHVKPAAITHLMGDTAITTTAPVKTKPIPVIDSTKQKPYIMGLIAPYKKPTPVPPKKGK